MFLLVLMLLCCHNDQALAKDNLVQVEMTDATMSSTWSAAFSASMCINKKTSGSGSVCSSRDELRPWFKTMLAQPVVVASVRVVNRWDVKASVRDRMDGAEVTVWETAKDDSTNTKVADCQTIIVRDVASATSTVELQTYDLTCACNAPGAMVMIQVPGPEERALNMAEVSVYTVGCEGVELDPDRCQGRSRKVNEGPAISC